ncbi:hypothetical protein [Cupriavidus metallidurans]|uniref:hypothetical protein n=1 Tax=Cupriavidus metallidurans TaxID=119219 RepID=UPI001CCD550A|nr:hypothetical protein [Cupriavidus metallidurans]UBM09162.1 hypothetical protein LAI70_04520 [Cupriavidus metallidurans]
MKHPHIITLKAAVLGALIATLGACATQSGPTYTLNAVQRSDITGQAYEASCTGLLESSKTCMKVANEVCKDAPVVPVGSVDGYRSGSPTNDPRKLTFTCGKPAVAKAQ